MRDDLQGGLLATVVATPIVVICCGGGGVLLAATAAAVGGRFTGPGGMATILAAAIAALTMRSIRRARTGCALPDADNEPGKPAIHGT